MFGIDSCIRGKPFINEFELAFEKEIGDFKANLPPLFYSLQEKLKWQTGQLESKA